MRVPQEIYDEIIGLTDFLTAVKAQNIRASAQLYDENIHTWEWAAEGGHLDALKWLQKNHIGIRRRGNEMFEPHAEYNVLHAAWHAGHEAVVDWLLKNRPEMQIACRHTVNLVAAIEAKYSASHLVPPLTTRFGWLQGVNWPVGSEWNQDALRNMRKGTAEGIDLCGLYSQVHIPQPRSLDSEFQGFAVTIVHPII